LRIYRKQKMLKTFLGITKKLEVINMVDINIIKKDNEHFDGDITFIKISISDYADFRDFGYTMYLEVGCTGNNYRAIYNYHPIRLQWELGCN